MAADTVADQLRQAAPLRYFAHLLGPEPARPALAGLYLFEHELAHVRDHVREPAMGEIRLQWWAEVLEGARADEARGHPLATALLAAAARHSLPRATLAAMVEARRADLFDDAPVTMTDVEGQAGETTGALLRLAALVIAPDAEGPLADLAGHGGCALAISETLRRLPLFFRRGQCPLPLDLLARHGLDRETFRAGGGKAEAAVGEFAAAGRAHWDSFLGRADAMPGVVNAAFVLAAPSARALAASAADPASVLAHGVAPAPLRDRWAMLRAASGHWPR